MAYISDKELYLANLMNIKQIMMQLNELNSSDGLKIDVKYYQNEINNIIRTTEKLINEGSESIPYQFYNDRLNYIINELNDEAKPLNNIRLYSCKINDLLEDISKSTFDEVVKNTIDLINAIFNLKLTNIKGDAIINKAYKTIYNVLLHGAMIDNYDLLNYSPIHSNDVLRENLGTLIQKDLKKLPQDELLNIKLKYQDRGLGYDYLNSDILNKISSIALGNKYKEFINKKQSASYYILEQADKLKKEQEDFYKEKNEKDVKIRDYRSDLAKKRLKLYSLILVPIIGLYSLGYLGSFIKRKTLNTTRKVDVYSDKEISSSTMYENLDYGYKAVIKKYGPWRENITGDGYVRDAVEVVYTADEMSENIDFDELIKSIHNRYEFLQRKQELDPTDSMTEPEMIVTETIVDKNDSLPRPEFIALLPLLGIAILGIVDAILYHFDNEYFSTLKRTYRDVRSERNSLKNAKRGRITRNVIVEKLTEIGNKTVKLQEQYTETINKYGEIENKIDPELIEQAKKYVLTK